MDDKVDMMAKKQETPVPVFRFEDIAHVDNPRSGALVIELKDGRKLSCRTKALTMEQRAAVCGWYLR